MGYRQAIALLIAAAASGAGSESDIVLQRTREKVLAASRSMLSYACTETIQREFYAPVVATLPRECPVLLEQRQHPTPDMVLHLASKDRLRLEVATSSRGEIHSWPGSSAFTEAGIDTLVRKGPIGTGSFGILLSVIFTSDVKKFGFEGDQEIAGQRQLVYTFHVPVSDSHYRVKTQDGRDWLKVGYEGVLYVDAETGDPIRVTTTTLDVPSAAGVCQTTSTLKFTRDAAVGEELLIPVSAAQRFVGITGTETQNTITFSACRQYSSQSTISFFTSPDETGPARRVAAHTPLPEVPSSIQFAMELLTPIDSDTAAAGDRFTARLTEAMRDGKRTVAAKGALIEGRVTDVEVSYYPNELVAIGLKPESIEIRGAKVPFAAQLDLRGPIVLKQQKARKGLQFLLAPPREVPHEFRLPGSHNILQKGFTSNWLTMMRRP